MFSRTLSSCLVVSLALVCTGCAGSTEPEPPFDMSTLTQYERRLVESCEGKRTCMEIRLYKFRFAERYRATKRPVFQLKFRHQYPTMSEEEIEVLVNDEVEEGLKEALEQERKRIFDRPVMAPTVRSPSVNCTSSRIGNSTYTNCY